MGRSGVKRSLHKIINPPPQLLRKRTSQKPITSLYLPGIPVACSGEHFAREINCSANKENSRADEAAKCRNAEGRVHGLNNQPPNCDFRAIKMKCPSSGKKYHELVIRYRLLVIRGGKETICTFFGHTKSNANKMHRWSPYHP